MSFEINYAPEHIAEFELEKSRLVSEYGEEAVIFDDEKRQITVITE